MVFLAIFYLVAQIPFSESAWAVAAQSGFNAILVLVLLTINYFQRKDERHDRERDRRQISLLTRAVTEQTLAMNWLPKTFHDGAKAIIRDIEADEDNRV